MKFIKIFFALEFFACGFFGITQYNNTSKIANLFASIFCFIIAFLLFRSACKKKFVKALPKQTDDTPEQKKDTDSSNGTNTIKATSQKLPTQQTISQPASELPNTKSNPASVKQLETAQQMLNDSLSQLNKALSSGNIAKVTVQQNTDSLPAPDPNTGVSYVEDSQMIVRTDGKEITDEEVPYLIQLGQDKAIAKWKTPDLTRLITESYQIMRTTDNPETLCSRYKFIVEKTNELAAFEQQGLFDANTFNQYKALISDDNFYNLILICYQKYTAKARSELKTQNGINNRIKKFWNVIRSNVSVEFYKAKFLQK